MIQIVSYLRDDNYSGLVNKINIDFSSKNATNYKCKKIDYYIEQGTILAFILYEKIIYTEDEK